MRRIIALIAASAVAFTVVSLPLATPISAQSCDDVKFIFARGSGQSLGAAEYSSFKSSIETALRKASLGLKYSFYELGSASYGGGQYPAIAMDTISAIGAKISAGRAFDFGNSVRQGKTELKSYISQTSNLCKNTKFVLGGYSQGAMVMTDSIPDLDPNKVIYSATFGDPYLYLPEGKGLFPPACRGENLSDYRVFAPNCNTSEGILGGKKPYEPSSWAGKIGLWCNNKDFMCGAGLEFTIDFSTADVFDNAIDSALKAGHLNYVSDGHFQSAASIIIEKLKTAFKKTSPKTTAYSNRDTVFLIDHTTSMTTHIRNYINEAKRLAKETIDGGGRIALYTYGDLIDATSNARPEYATPIKMLDLGATYEEFCDLIGHIKLAGGGDEPESALSALLTIMNEQHWKPNATKSIIVLTDATFLSPDRDGTTLEQVVKRSLEIDPVNIYAVNTTGSASFYDNITTLTGGAIFTTTDSLSTDYLLLRPNANFSLSNYYGLVGDEITFTVTTDGNIVKYEWDLDFDGVFESTSTGPSISKVYNQPSSGFIQFKATNSSGQSSTASALLSVTSSMSALPNISNLDYSLDSTTLNLSYSLGEDTAGVFVSVDGAILGATNQTSLQITDFTRSSTVTITPISSSGQIGEPVSFTINIDAPAKDSASSKQPATILAPKSGIR